MNEEDRVETNQVSRTEGVDLKSDPAVDEVDPEKTTASIADRTNEAVIEAGQTIDPKIVEIAGQFNRPAVREEESPDLVREANANDDLVPFSLYI